MTRHGSCLPDPNQELLIRALLSPPEHRENMWRQWKDRISLDSLDPGSLRLLPLLYYRLKKSGISDSSLKAYRGIYRHFWYRNRIYLGHLGRILNTLNAHNIVPVLLKGLPLALTVYSDPGLRPMLDMDLYVPPHQLLETVLVLKENGWTPDRMPPEKPDERWLAAVKAVHLAHPDGISIDLHGTWMSEIADPVLDREMGGRSTPFSIADGKARLPDPTDLLFHTIVHGHRWNTLPPFRWIVDAVELIQAAGDRLDMNRMMQTAERYHLHTRLTNGLVILKRHMTSAGLDADIIPTPSPGYHAPRWERLEHRLKTAETEVVARTGNVAFDCWRWIRRFEGKSRYSELANHLKQRWHIRRAAKLPVEAVRRVCLRLRGKAQV